MKLTTPISTSIFLFVLSLFIFNPNASGQHQAEDWTYFNTENSEIPSDRLISLAIDENNVVWMGTVSSGLVSFDGSTWTTYNTANSDIPTDNVQNLHAQDGSIWMSNIRSNGAIYLSRFKNGIWTVWDDFSYLQGIDGDNEGNIWISTYNKGLCKLTDAGYDCFNSSNSCLYQDKVTAAYYQVEDSILWVGMYGSSIDGSQAGLVKMQGDTCEVFNMSNSGFPTDNYVYSIFPDPDDSSILWINTNRGSALFDGTDWEIVAFAGNASTREIAIDNLHAIWIGALFHGAVRITTTTEVFYGLPDWEINGIDVDIENRIWMATGNKGLAVFENISTSSEEKQGVTEKIYCTPTVVKEDFELLWESDQFRVARFTLYNYSSYPVLDMKVNSGKNSIQVDNSWPNGLYFYHLTSDSGEIVGSGKLIVLR